MNSHFYYLISSVCIIVMVCDARKLRVSLRAGNKLSPREEDQMIATMYAMLPNDDQNDSKNKTISRIKTNKSIQVRAQQVEKIPHNFFDTILSSSSESVEKSDITSLNKLGINYLRRNMVNVSRISYSDDFSKIPFTLFNTKPPTSAPTISNKNAAATSSAESPPVYITLIFPPEVGKDILSISSRIFQLSIVALEQSTNTYLSDMLKSILNDENESIIKWGSDDGSFSFAYSDLHISSPSSNHRALHNLTLDRNSTFSNFSEQIENYDINGEIYKLFTFNGKLIFHEEEVPDLETISNALFTVLKDDGGTGFDGMRYLRHIKYSFDSVLEETVGLTVSINQVGSFTTQIDDSALFDTSIKWNSSTSPPSDSSSSSNLLQIGLLVIVAITILVTLYCIYLFIRTHVLSSHYNNFPSVNNKTKRNKKNSNIVVNTAKTTATSPCTSAVVSSCKSKPFLSIAAENENSSNDEDDNDSFYQELVKSRTFEVENGIEIITKPKEPIEPAKHVSFKKQLTIIAEQDKSRPMNEKVAQAMTKESAPKILKTQSLSPTVNRKHHIVDANETFIPNTPLSPKPSNQNMNINTNTTNTMPAPFFTENSATNEDKTLPNNRTKPFSETEDSGVHSNDSFFWGNDNLSDPWKETPFNDWLFTSTDKNVDDQHITNKTEVEKQQLNPVNSFNFPINDSDTLSTDKALANRTDSTKDMTVDSSTTNNNNELKLVSDVLKELKKVSKFLNKRMNGETALKILSDVDSNSKDSSLNTYDMKSTIKTISTITPVRNADSTRHTVKDKTVNMYKLSPLPRNIEIGHSEDIQASVLSSLGGVDESNNQKYAPPKSIEVKVQSVPSREIAIRKETSNRIHSTMRKEQKGTEMQGHNASKTAEKPISNQLQTKPLRNYEDTNTRPFVISPTDTEKALVQNPYSGDLESETVTESIDKSLQTNSIDENENRNTRPHPVQVNKPHNPSPNALSNAIRTTNSYTEKFLDREVKTFFNDTDSNITERTGTTRSTNDVNVISNRAPANQPNPVHKFIRPPLNIKEQRNPTSRFEQTAEVVKDSNLMKPYKMKKEKSDLSAAFTINTIGEVIDKDKGVQSIERLMQSSVSEEEEDMTVEDEIMHKRSEIQLEKTRQTDEPYGPNAPYVPQIDSMSESVPDGKYTVNDTSTEGTGNEFMRAKELIPMFERIHPGPTRPPRYPNAESMDTSTFTTASLTEDSFKKKKPFGRLGAKPFDASISSIQHYDSEGGSTTVQDSSGSLSSMSFKPTSPNNQLSNNENVSDAPAEQKDPPPTRKLKVSPTPSMTSSQSSYSEGFFEKEVESLFSDNKRLTSKTKPLPIRNDPRQYQGPRTQRLPPVSTQLNQGLAEKKRVSILGSGKKETIDNTQKLRNTNKVRFPDIIEKQQSSKIRPSYSSSTEDDSSANAFPLDQRGAFPTSKQIRPTVEKHDSPKSERSGLQPNEKTLIISNKSQKFVAAAGKVLNYLKENRELSDLDPSDPEDRSNVIQNYKNIRNQVPNETSQLTEEQISKLKARALISMFEKKTW